MPKPTASHKMYQFLINIFELEKCLFGKFLYKSASAHCLAPCRNDAVGDAIREVCARLNCDLGLTLARKLDASVWIGHAFWKNFGEIRFLSSRLCYWQAKKTTSYLKPLSWSFRNTNDLQVSREVYGSTGCPGSLGTGWAPPESGEDCMGTFQPNPLPLWVSLSFQ